MQPLGTLAADFSLPDVLSGKLVTRDGVKGAGGLLVMFLCVHCPFVKYIEQDLIAYLPSILDQNDAEVTRRCEHMIRNYDPCISCATTYGLRPFR